MIDYLASWGPTFLMMVIFVVAITINLIRSKRLAAQQLEMSAAQITESRKLNQALERIATLLEKQAGISH
jgi:hypothetical protein